MYLSNYYLATYEMLNFNLVRIVEKLKELIGL